MAGRGARRLSFPQPQSAPPDPPGDASMKLDLTGKRAIITAGGAGIGRKTAEVFAAAGARIVICDIDSEAVDSARADIPGLPGPVCDVADAGALDALLGAAIQIRRARGGEGGGTERRIPV